MIEHSPFKNESRMEKADRDTAKRLKEEFNLNVKSQGYHYRGILYNNIEIYDFPAVFFDLFGYIIINSEFELKVKMESKRKVRFNRISKMSGYIHYPHEPQGIENYKEVIEKIKEEKYIRGRKNIKTKEERQKEFSKFHNIMQKCVIQNGGSHVIKEHIRT